MELKTLYKKTNTGALQFWRIYTEENVVYTEYGQVGSVNIQTTEDVITEGKNLGKKNETTPEKQAVIEARQKWEKKLKSGYLDDRDRAENNETDLDGIKPMLAHVYEDYQNKLKFPVVVQPKLDGMRCIAAIKNGKAKLFSRTQKSIETVPHIVTELERLYSGMTITLDGELYVHDGDNFNELMSILKRDELHPDHEKIEYWVYDVESSEPYEKRAQLLPDILESNKVKPITMDRANSHDEVKSKLQQYIQNGFEGAMVRDLSSGYENKRSKALLKYKLFIDDEFEVIGVEEGKGKLQGKAGAFVCKTKDGLIFNVKMEGSLESLTDYLINFNKYEGKLLTVRFFSYTIKGVPRFPVGVGFRDERDLDV